MNVEGMQSVIDEIIAERERCVKHFDEQGTDIHDFDKYNSENDWVSYICCYAGRAADKVHSNDNENPMRFRSNMIKVANLAIAAVQAFDEGYCWDES